MNIDIFRLRLNQMYFLFSNFICKNNFSFLSYNRILYWRMKPDSLLGHRFHIFQSFIAPKVLMSELLEEVCRNLLCYTVHRLNHEIILSIILFFSIVFNMSMIPSSGMMHCDLSPLNKKQQVFNE